jgi:hypothetical protein
MTRGAAALLIGVVLGLGLGFVLGSNLGHGSTSQGLQTSAGMGDAAHDHAAHDHGQGDMSGHDHSGLIEAGTPAPTLTLRVHPDGKQSRNLHIETTNFTFDPEGVNGPHKAGHGHAHVYINGVKQPRAYGPWMQLHALPIGTHEVRVTLSANDHSQLAINGQPIEATTTLVID